MPPWSAPVIDLRQQDLVRKLLPARKALEERLGLRQGLRQAGAHLAGNPGQDGLPEGRGGMGGTRRAPPMPPRQCFAGPQEYDTSAGRVRRP